VLARKPAQLGTPRMTSTALESVSRPASAPVAQADISVVVSTYDRSRWGELSACLQTLRGQTVSPREVVVVVDHNPGLLSAARESFRWAKVVENHRPRGLAGARNTGVDITQGSIVAFIDDDARADTDWLEHLQACFADLSAVGVGGALIPRWTNGFPRWLPTEFYWVLGCSYTGLPSHLAPVRNPIGANMAVRREILQAIGGFRDGAAEQPHVLRSRGVVRAAGNVPDDTDLAIRVKQLWPGSTWLYQPQARVHHTVVRERTSLGYFIRRSFEEGAGKARLAAFVGAQDGLSSERRHLAVVLPSGIARGLRSLLSGDWHGGLRAAAIVIGTVSSAAGFLAATAGRTLRRDPVGR
jgi:glycosyltransferase involved in cell wall biosynthesis